MKDIKSTGFREVKMNEEVIKRMYDCRDKPYTEHPNYITTSFIDGHEIWDSRDEVESILTKRGEMWARSFWAGFHSKNDIHSLQVGSMRKYFDAPLRVSSSGKKDLRHIL